MNEKKKTERRKFLKYSYYGFMGLLNVSVIGFVVAHLFKGLMPSWWTEEKYKEEGVHAGNVDENFSIIGKGKVIQDVENNRKAIVINDGNSIKALSLTCPHLGCQVKWQEEKNCFLCPCHMAKFNADGSRIMPNPSPKPLTQYKVAINGSQVYVIFREPAYKPEALFRGNS